MLRDSLSERLATDEPALGGYTNDPDMVELMAHIGFDWVLIDQMFTSSDWSKTELLIRTAEAAGITPMIRLQSNPWQGHDPRIAVDVMRAAGIGAQYILISNSGKKEIEQAAKVAHDWHRKPMHIHPFDGFDDWEPRIQEMERRTYIIPAPEAVQALEEIEDTIRIPEVGIHFLAMTDASRVLTGSERPDFYADVLWELLDRAVALGRETNTIIGANTSYAYDLAEMQRRILRLHEHGVRVIMVQGAPFLFQLVIGKFLRDVRSALTEAVTA